MSKVIVFNKQAGVNRVRGVKRFRGDKGKPGPEIKKYNCLASEELAQTTLTSYDFVNNIRPSASDLNPAYLPVAINWPLDGSRPEQRIGSRITLNAIRFKGWVSPHSMQVVQIRWRLILFRIDGLPGATFNMDQAGYIQQWSNGDDTLPGATFNLQTYGSYCRHNFYKKFKNVDNKDFKAKVIAQGCLPPQADYKRLQLQLTGTIAGNQAVMSTVNAANPSFLISPGQENFGYMPIDVTVKINDTVDCEKNLRRYFVVLESDVGYGWSTAGAPQNGSAGMVINMYARAYFTDT